MTSNIRMAVLWTTIAFASQVEIIRTAVVARSAAEPMPESWILAMMAVGLASAFLAARAGRAANLQTHDGASPEESRAEWTWLGKWTSTYGRIAGLIAIEAALPLMIAALALQVLDIAAKIAGAAPWFMPASAAIATLASTAMAVIRAKARLNGLTGPSEDGA